MKKGVLSLSMLASVLFVSGTIFGQRNCGTMENLDRMNQLDPQTKTRLAEIDAFTEKVISNGTVGQEKVVITIPVVFHILYNTTAQNISLAQIQSQMDVLNKDFRKLNADAGSTPSAFTSVAADCEINFCMASVDPNGAATTGIIRKQTATTAFSADNSNMKYTSTGGSDAWPASKYLNVWVCNLGGGILGFAQFPGGAAATDGVVMGYTCFGVGGTSQAPYNKGRTATHEVGHWLNLRHIWGDDGTACTGSDLVSDTPNQAGPNYGCPSFPKVSCSNAGDMHMNYMDYVDDGCMFMFSAGQKARVQALFVTGGARASLKTSNGCSGTTTPAPAAYCAANGTNVAYEWIARVQVGTINNATAANAGYGNFTNLSTSLTKGTAYSIGLTPGFASTAYPEYFRVYIDWNNDKDFVDAGELVVTTTGVSATTSASITVPTTAATASVRMRVMMKDAAITGPCEVFTYGEVEDYTLNLVAASTACSDTYESNNTIGTAKARPVNTVTTALVGTSTDVDFFSIVNTSTNKNIKVTLTNLAGDYDLVLYNSAGAQLAISENGGTTSESLVYNNGVVGTYYIKVLGYNGAFSASACYSLTPSIGSAAFKTEAPEEVIAKEPINAMVVAPNPSSDGKVVVQLTEAISGDYSLIVLDASGRIVFTTSGTKEEGTAFSVSPNLENMNNGMYFVQLRNNQNIYTEKLLLSK